MSEKFNLVPVENFLDQVNDSELYADFLLQIQKDIVRAGIVYQIKSFNPKKLFFEITELLCNTMQHDFNDYVNLLYAVDVSEAEVKKADYQEVENIAKYATLLILKRELQKVWYRKNY